MSKSHLMALQAGEDSLLHALKGDSLPLHPLVLLLPVGRLLLPVTPTPLPVPPETPPPPLLKPNTVKKKSSMNFLTVPLVANSRVRYTSGITDLGVVFDLTRWLSYPFPPPPPLLPFPLFLMLVSLFVYVSFVFPPVSPRRLLAMGKLSCLVWKR